MFEELLAKRIAVDAKQLRCSALIARAAIHGVKKKRPLHGADYEIMKRVGRTTVKLFEIAVESSHDHSFELIRLAGEGAVLGLRFRR